MSDTTLTFHTAYGVRVAEAPLSGEARAFGARITREGGGYLVALTTYGRPLDAWHFRILAEARAWAQASYDAVNL